MLAKIGIAIGVVGLVAWYTGPGPTKSATNPPLQTVLGGADALGIALGGAVLWFLSK